MKKTYQELTKCITVFMLAIFMFVTSTLTLQAETKDAQQIVDSLNEVMPKIDGDKIILPEVDEGFEITLYGSDNKQIIDMDLNYYQPLDNQRVHVMYQIVNTEDSSDVGISKEDITVHVQGKYDNGEMDNNKPEVIPALREWKGNQGDFEISSDTKVIYDFSKIDSSFINKTIKKYIEHYSLMTIELVNGSSADAKPGDIVIEFDNTIKNLGNEGYSLSIEDVLTITASDTRGLNYAGVTLGQILQQSETGREIPKGLARDYPKYEVRAGMLDVGRVYMPLEYVQEITEYMAWYKLNEIQLHINDYWGSSNYTAFRVESKVYPEINAKDGYYTQEEYIKYQEDMKTYGIDVVTEIDTPFHADVFKLIDPSLVWKPGHLDIRTEESREKVYEVVEKLYDEMLGDSPTDPNRVFLSSKFHIGTDEYDHDYSEQMRIYTDYMLKYVNDKGYESRLWGELGTYGYDGDTEVTNEATMTIWAPYRSDTQEMYDLGYDIINVTGGDLYIVPVGNAGFPDYLDIEGKYDAFEVNNYMGSGRSGGKGGAIMPFAHPQTKGAMFALWNDMTSFNGGLSSLDIFNRYKDGIYLISEKTWFGEKQEDQTASEFMERVAKTETFNPLSNPSYRYQAESTLLLEYDFENIEGDLVKDKSGNGFDAKLKGAENSIIDGKLRLDGSTTLELPIESLGYPYSVSFNLKLDEHQLQNASILKSEDGEVLLDIADTGELGYIRNEKTSEGSTNKFENYQFSFNKKLEIEEWHNIRIDGDNTHTNLYIDNVHVSRAKQINRPGKRVGDSTTLLLPLKVVGENVKGELDNFKIYDKSMQSSLRRNFALDAKATASSEYNNVQSAKNINDGDTASRWGSVYQDNQWVILEMDQVRSLNEFVIRWESSRAKTYKIHTSLDGTNYDEVYAHNSNNPGTDTITLDDPVDAKYVKLEMINRSNTKYGFSIFEFELYGLQDFEYGKTLANKARADLDFISLEYSGKSERENLEVSIVNMLSVYEESEINILNYDEYLKQLTQDYDAFIKSIIELENLALNQKVTAQSTHPGTATLTMKPEFLVDGNMNTRWGSDYRAASGFPNTESWVTIEFDKLTTLDMLALRWEGARSKNYTVTYSTDNENFEPLVSFDNYISKDYNDVLVFEPTEVKSIRFDFNGNVTKYGFSLYEIEAYNTDDLIKSIKRTEELSDKLDIELYDEQYSNEVISNVKRLESYFKNFERNSIDYHTILNSVSDNYGEFIKSIVMPNDFDIINDKEQLEVGETTQLELKYSPEKSYVETIIWESTNSEVLSIDENGLVTAHKKGTETINVTLTFDGIKDSITKSISIEILGEDLIDEAMLRELISTINGLDASEYTPESYDALMSATIEVEELIESPMTNEEIKESYERLEILLESLVPVEEVDVSVLEELITKFNGLVKGDYTKDSYNALNEEIEEAVKLLDGFHTQEEVNGSIDRINALFDALEESVKINIDRLEELIEEINNLDEQSYTPETFIPLKNKMKEAEALLKTEYTQKQVNDMVIELEELKTLLKEIVVIDKTELDKILSEFEAIDLSLYTEQSASIIKEEIEKAKLAAEEALTQEEVDRITSNLEELMTKVVKLEDAYVNLPFTGLPTHVKVGDVFTLIPEFDNQDGSNGWIYDSNIFSVTFNSPATFTALKEGESTITFVDMYGRTQSAVVKVTAKDDVKPPQIDEGDKEKPKDPPTGVQQQTNFGWMMVTTLSLFVLIIVFKKKRITK